MNRDELKVSHRDVLGKKVRFLRREGLTPVNLYGPNIESLSLQVETSLLKRLIAKVGRNALIALNVDSAKEPRMAMIRDMQRHPLTGDLLHVGFFQVEMTHSVKADVPLLFLGEAPAAMTSHTMLIENLTSLEVEALPANLPRNIVVDLTVLKEINQSIHVRDIVVGEAVEVLTDPDQLVVKVMESKVEKLIEEEAVSVEEAEAPPGEAEGEEKSE
ncbi:MAG TPA: 50S ribosomal protein L25 [Dehalococcoidia bacterium]|nr:50S ribosomal protein L25 [Dehalococcoidia bacterium]